jgi:probable rRNA maturation factor
MYLLTYEQEPSPIDIELVKLAVSLPISQLVFLPLEAQVSISFLNESKMEKIAHEWGYSDKTESLSFPFCSSLDEIYRESMSDFVIGEVVLCSKKMLAHGARQSFLLEIELLRCIFHGILHLLGYNHRNLYDKERMFTLQNRLLYISMGIVDRTIH